MNRLSAGTRFALRLELVSVACASTTNCPKTIAQSPNSVYQVAQESPSTTISRLPTISQNRPVPGAANAVDSKFTHRAACKARYTPLPSPACTSPARRRRHGQFSYALALERHFFLPTALIPERALSASAADGARAAKFAPHHLASVLPVELDPKKIARAVYRSGIRQALAVNKNY